LFVVAILVAIAPSAIANDRASITAATNDPDTGDHSATAPAAVEPARADLSATKYTETTNALPNSIFGYTFFTRRRRPTARGASPSPACATRATPLPLRSS
jgi:hypothetical protein